MKISGRLLATVALTAMLAAPLGAQERIRATLGDMSRYAGWGMAIGATGGLIYGLAVERRSTRSLDIVGDVAIGGFAGLVGGVAVYLAKSAIHATKLRSSNAHIRANSPPRPR